MPTLEAIQAKMKKLQAQAETLIARKGQAALDQIRELMIEHGLTTADIEAKAKARRERARVVLPSATNGKAKPVATKGKMPPKYLNSKTGETWSGHARPPAWIKDVKDRSKFLIEGAGTDAMKEAGAARRTKGAAKKASATAGKVAKGQAKGKQPPKYLEPKTGATWSGRGPAPAWLASAKDRTKFLIDGAADTSPVSKASKPKAAATRGAIAGKTASKKAVATKKTASNAKAPVKKTTVARKAAATNPAGLSRKKAGAPVGRKSGIRNVSAGKAVAGNPAVAASDAAAVPAAS